MRRLKDNMKRVLLLLLAFLLVATAQPAVAEAAASESMTIYGMYFNAQTKGDAVLIKSAGEYIVMDLGMYDNMVQFADQLDALGVTHFKLYISHLHVDHVGGKVGNFMVGLNYLQERGFTIDYLYVLDPSLAPESTSYDAKYAALRTYMNDYMGGEDRIMYLKQGSQFTVGYAKFEVLAPSLEYVNTIHPKDYATKVDSTVTNLDSASAKNTMSTYYENNCSLVTRVTCNGVSFLTGGDLLADEAAYLVKELGSSLKSDIYQLSHHGTALGNTEELLNAIDPVYTFAINNGSTAYDTQLKQWAFNRALTVSKPVSMPYFVANEQKTIAYRVSNGGITLYQGADLSSLKRVKGWIGVTGADGSNRTKDYYYIGDDGLPKASVQQINGVTYCFTDSGCMEYGDYSADGSYMGWKEYSALKHKYFKLVEGTELAEMLTGFQKINGYLYYFDEKGWLEESLDEKGFIDIGEGTYLMDEEGVISTNELYEQDGKQYYFGEDGTMVKKKIVVLGGDSYYFGKYGTKQYNLLAKIGKNTYYFDGEGKMVKDSEQTIGTKEYYFDGDGVMACKQIVELGGASYYYGKYGTKVKSQLVKIGSNKYYFDEEGKMVKGQEYQIGTKEYYFDADGVMASKQIVELEDGSYYFGKYGTKVRDKIVKVGDGRYYFDADGRMVKDEIVTVGKKTYAFGEDGQMLYRKLVTGEDGNLYFFGKRGTMVTSKTLKIDGVTYTFDENGIGTTAERIAG